MSEERARLVRAVRYYVEVRGDLTTQCWVRGGCKPGEGEGNSCAHHRLIDALAAYDAAHPEEAK